MRIGKDLDPDPYLWLRDPDPDPPTLRTRYNYEVVFQRIFLESQLFIFDAGVRGLPERVPAGAAPEQPQDVRVPRDGGGQPRERRLPRASRQGQRPLRRLLQGRRQVQGNGFWRCFRMSSLPSNMEW